jgi:hypothetical protein
MNVKLTAHERLIEAQNSLKRTMQQLQPEFEIKKGTKSCKQKSSTNLPKPIFTKC